MSDRGLTEAELRKIEPSISGETRPATTTKRCPKCKSKTINLIEVGEWSLCFHVVDGLFNRAAGYHEPGCMLYLFGECGCGHHWRIRGAIQITDAVTQEWPDRRSALHQSTEAGSPLGEDNG